VNGDPVTAQDIVDLFSDRHSGHAKFLGGNAEAREFLKIVIDDKLMVQEAYEIGLDRDPTVVKLTTDLERTRVESFLIKSEIDSKAVPGPDEIREAWKKLATVIVLREIRFNTRTEAQEARAAILHGEDLESLARSCSIADSRVHGGRDIVNWGQMEPAWEDAVFRLEAGELSDIIPTRDGFDLVFVENKAEVELPPFEKVKDQIAGVLQARRIEARKSEFSDDLWRRYHVVRADCDCTPAGLLNTPRDKVLASWDQNGRITAGETFNDADLRKWAALPPQRAQYEIDSRIRSTINSPLLMLEAAARNTAAEASIAEEVRKYREYLMEAVLFRDHVFKGLAASAEETSRYYNEHKSEFVAPEQRHVAQILLSSEKDAVQVRKSMREGLEFSAAVKRYSRDPISSMQEGDLGWITADKVPPAFKEVLKMGAGETSNPLHSSSGWHLIRVLEIKPPRQMTFDEVKEKVQAKCLDLKRQTERDRWIQKLRAASKIEVDDAAIAGFVKDNEFTAATPPQHKLQ